MKAWMALKRSTTNPRVGNWQLPYEISWLARASGKILHRRSVWNRVNDAPEEDDTEERLRSVSNIQLKLFKLYTENTDLSNTCSSFCSGLFGATSPMRKSSSCRTSTASLTFMSGSVRFSQALRIEVWVISENLARKTCRLGFTKRNADTALQTGGRCWQIKRKTPTQ